MNAKTPSILSAAVKPGLDLPGSDIEAVRTKVFVAPAIEAAGAATAARVVQARELTLQGRRLAARGQMERAIAKFEQAVRLDPINVAAHENLGVALTQGNRLDKAAQSLARALSVDPDRAGLKARLSLVLEHQGRLVEAEPILQEAVTEEPENFELLARLARVKGARGKIEESVQALHAAAAVARAAGSPRAATFEIRALLQAERLDEAEALARSAIAAGQGEGEAQLLLGQLLAEQGRSEEALPHFERALAVDPKQTWAWLGLSANGWIKPGDEPLVRRMALALQRKDLTDTERQPIHFALGKAYEALGDYQTAMRWFDSANAIRKARRRLDREGLVGFIDSMIAASPPGFLAARPDLASASDKPLLILGMPRSGTTLTEQILSAHPGVAAGGELGDWTLAVSEGLRPTGQEDDASAAQKAAQGYLRVLDAIDPTAPRVTDKAPFNYIALGIIRQLFPNAAIVHCRRDPIDVCLSIYTNDFTAGFEFAADRGDLVFYYRQYERLMAHWRRVIPPHRFVELDYDALVADPEPVTRRLLEGVGLAWDDACLSPHLNARRRITTASLWQARQPIYRSSAQRWRRYEPWLGELRELMDETTLIPAPSLSIPAEGSL